MNSIESFYISPFQETDIPFNKTLSNDDFAITYLNQRFGEDQWQYTSNGREAIRLALQKYNLTKNDLVTIVTTTENFYISSCVTNEINNFCSWNREIVPETKVIFVNHEFGYPYPNMEKLLQTGLPVIEDCCTTFFSQDANDMIGKYGDYSVYSFPKFFPIQMGGLIVSNKGEQMEKSTRLNDGEANYIQNVISHHLRNEAQLLQRRKDNFDYALAAFSKLGFNERLQKNAETVPSVLLMNNNEIIKDLPALKIFLTNNRIESSIFYGEDAFFIPSHQCLHYKDINYFSYLINTFINQQQKG